MEPSTPPRAQNSRGVPATPATPRFGTFEDLPDAERKHLRARTPHRRKRSAAELATPRQTPHKRKALVTPKQQLVFNHGLKLEGVDEEAEESASTSAAAHSEHELELEGEPVLSDEESEFEEPRLPSAKEHLSKEDHEPIAEPYAEWGHPHQDRPPPNVPGMWYVFRGKKVFRPLPAGAKPVEPVTLFKTEIEQQRRVSESEEDTDVESLW